MQTCFNFVTSVIASLPDNARTVRVPRRLCLVLDPRRMYVHRFFASLYLCILYVCTSCHANEHGTAPAARAARGRHGAVPVSQLPFTGLQGGTLFCTGARLSGLRSR